MAEYAAVMTVQSLLARIRMARQREGVTEAEDAIVRVVSDLCTELGKPKGIPIMCRICHWPIGAADHTHCLAEAFATVEYIW